ncbi:MAG: VanZ family protein [Alphaproteobacteria bacterium]
MRVRSRETWFALLAAAVVITILIVCLYPFRFAVRHGGIDAVAALVGSWAKPPSAIDFILNIALYVPLGAFAALSLQRLRRPWHRVAMVTIGGGLLSIAVELTQYFDAARYTSATDVYANTLGTFLGAAAVVLLFRR